MSTKETARTYNQSHVPRKDEKGHRRVSAYVSWSYPGEANRSVTELDNRYSTMTDVRRALWPNYEAPRFADPMMFQQGIAGSLELFFWAWVRFQKVVEEATGHAVPMFQRGASSDLKERAMEYAHHGDPLVPRQRQFEFVQSEWINGGDFAGLEDVKDPIAGAVDGAGAFSVPERPIPCGLRGLPRFVVTRGGEYCFMPGLSALRWLADLET